jgi:hypothetical protein
LEGCPGYRFAHPGYVARAIHGLELAAALPIVGIGYRIASPTRRREAILGVIAVGEGAVAGEVAVGVAGRGDRAHGRVLVERVRGVVHRARGRWVEPPAVVSGRLARALVGPVVGVGEGDRARGRNRRRRCGRPRDGGWSVQPADSPDERSEIRDIMPAW